MCTAATAITAFALLALGNASPARSSVPESAASTAPPITVPMVGQGWVTFPLPAGVNPARTAQHLMQGQSNGTECVFSNTATTSPGFAGQEDDEIALNPNTCEAVVASGPIQAASVASDAPSAGLIPDVLCGEACGGGGGGGTETAAFTKTWWEDPVGATVTSLRDDVDWVYAGGCDAAYDPKHAQTYLWETGWISDSQNNFTHLDCGAAISNSNAEMQNDPFCLAVFGDPEIVYTHYDYNHEVVGKANGSAVHAWSDYASSTLGGCYKLLSWHDAYGFETPYG